MFRGCQIETERIKDKDVLEGRLAWKLPLTELDGLHRAWSMMLLALKYRPELQVVYSITVCTGWYQYTKSRAQAYRDYYQSLATKSSS